MRWARLVPAVFALFTVFALRPLAEASPPDPTWIAGLYDNGDLDDVVLAATSATAALDARTANPLRPTLIVLGSIRDTGPDFFAPHGRFAHQPRSPPSR